MSTSVWVALVALLQCYVPIAHAGLVSVSGPIGGELEISAQDATVGEVLDRLARHEGFVVAGAPDASSTRRISGRMHGQINELLARLMRNESFTIVYSEDGSTKIQRIVLVGAGPNSGTAPPVHGDATRDVPPAGQFAKAIAGDNSDKPSVPAPAAIAPSAGAVPTVGALGDQGSVPMALTSSGVEPSQGVPSVGKLDPGGAVPSTDVGASQAAGPHPK